MANHCLSIRSIELQDAYSYLANLTPPQEERATMLQKLHRAFSCKERKTGNYLLFSEASLQLLHGFKHRRNPHRKEQEGAALAQKSLLLSHSQCRLCSCSESVWGQIDIMCHLVSSLQQLRSGAAWRLYPLELARFP